MSKYLNVLVLTIVRAVRSAAIKCLMILGGTA